MIIIVWSDYDGRNIEKFGEGRDGVALAEAKLLELHNLTEEGGDGEYGTTINMVIRGNEVQYEVKEVASAVKIKDK